MQIAIHSFAPLLIVLSSRFLPTRPEVPPPSIKIVVALIYDASWDIRKSAE
jgi:hypothetical protein